MRLRAEVHESTGNTRHSIATIIDDVLTPIEELPTPAWVEISEEGEGCYYLFYFDHDGTCLTDTWHQTLEDAKDQATYEFNIKPDEWVEIEPS